MARYGLLPESASHEGYLAHPVHSYWDDFWALRGLKDAAAMATELGHAKDAARSGRAGRIVPRDAARSIREVIAEQESRLCARLGRMGGLRSHRHIERRDAAAGHGRSAGEQLDAMFEHLRARLPPQARGRDAMEQLHRLRDPHHRRAGAPREARARRSSCWSSSSSDRRPRRWNQWPEISWRDPRSPGHLGDVPHTWIAAEYMLVFASLFAYEREADDALIIGAGVDERWLAARGGIAVRGLPTWHGALDLAMKREADGSCWWNSAGTCACRAEDSSCGPRDRAIRALSINGARPIHIQRPRSHHPRTAGARGHFLRRTLARGDAFASASEAYRSPLRS